MRTFALSLLATIASASAFQLKVSGGPLDGQYLSSLHEGAGINYFFLGSGGEDLTYNESDKSTSVPGSSIPMAVSVRENIVQLGVEEPAKTDISGGVFAVDGNKKFYACKNINDPYDYSTSEYAITTSSSVGSDCQEVSLEVVEGDASSSSSVAPSSTAAPFQNTTTTYQTVTDYTTYCPISTTVTITTCGNHKCAPTTITVEQPTTLTVTGECLIPSTTAAASSAKPTTPVTTSKPASSSSHSTVAAVSSYEGGANRAAAGVAGLVGVAAYLL